MRRSFALTAATVMLLAACSEKSANESGPASGDGYIRLPAPGAEMSAGYLTVTREEDDRLVGVSIDGIRRTELHTVTETDGVSRMRPVSSYTVKAGEPLVLEPGGRHLMLMGIAEPLKEGMTRTATLRFESGAEVDVELTVRDMQRSGGAGR